MKRITILGSTGSIGQSTLDVISRNRTEYRAVALVAGRNIGLLEDQITSFKPEVVAVADEMMAEKLAAGWKWGPEKNGNEREHPCLVPFAELQREQQAKDFIFRAVVHALASR